MYSLPWQYIDEDDIMQHQETESTEETILLQVLTDEELTLPWQYIDDEEEEELTSPWQYIDDKEEENKD